MTVILIFVSRPGQTKTSVSWHISQCQIQETEMTSAYAGARDSVATGRALKEFGPNTFEIMQSIVSQKNNQAQVGSSSGNTGHGAQRWVLHEVLHGCLGTIPGNSFSFVIRNEGASEGFRDEKSTLPGY